MARRPRLSGGSGGRLSGLRCACWLGLLLWGLPLRAAEADNLRAVVARLVPTAGWTAPEPARVAVGDGLFELIDGGAELYHEYGFRQAITLSLENAARSSIQVELYEMADPAAAYGAFSLMQSGKFVPGALGQGSLRFSYYLVFWSGSFFASVTGAQAEAATQAEVDRLGAQLAALLPPAAALPDWFSRLPSAGLQERMYFRGRIGLSNIPVGAMAGWFQVHEGLAARYPGVRVLLLHYADAPAAAAQLAAAIRKPALQEFRTETTGFTGVEGNGQRLTVRVQGQDLYAFSYTDEACYRAVVAALTAPGH